MDMSLFESIKNYDKKSYTLMIPLYLQRYPNSIFSKICYDLKINNAVADKTLTLLKDLKLVLEKETRGSNARIFSLTDKGYHLANKLNEIEKILEE